MKAENEYMEAKDNRKQWTSVAKEANFLRGPQDHVSKIPHLHLL
jgi:hypothetical protein